MDVDINLLKSLIDKGFTNKELANELKISRGSVIRIKSENNLKSKFNELKWETKDCLFCEKQFKCLISEERKFCSKNCTITFLNIERTQRKINENSSLIEKDNKIYKICEGCNLEYKIDRNYKKRKYCSIKCQQNIKKDKNFEDIRNGEDRGRIVSKKFLIELYGEKCMKCGWCERNPITNKVPIELEHKDGNSTNNTLENIELLCPNCHSLTSTYKALNKGNGRYKRRERYKDGKSY
jgi:hypothetical protein